MLEVRAERDINNDINNNPIVMQLIEFGIKPTFAKRIFQFYHPTNIDDVLDFLTYENDKIQHNFVQDRNNFENDLCYLCGELRSIHINYNLANNIHRSSNLESISNSISNKIGIHNSFSNYSLKSESKNSNNSISFQPEIECSICNESFLPNRNNTLKCGHKFCDGCWYDYFSVNIQENKITSIKCLDYSCQEKPDENFIINLLNSDNNLIEKYKRFKFNLEIINDPNKKMCPFPNCDSYLELTNEDNKNVKCLNNHIYCFFCLNKPHGNEPCNFQLKDSLVEYAKNNDLIKKCPKCNIVIQKNKGCNHITCTNCQYQWCWLCNEKYTFDHFNKGKCKGYQNFQPKNEHDIELAFEGKIQLSGSQIQDDFDVIRNEHNSDIIREFSFDNNSNISDRSENNNNFYRNNLNNSVENKKYFYCECDYKCKEIFETIILLYLYIFFGHIIISKKLYFQAWKNYFVLFSILLFELTFFFLQVYINILMLFPYLFKVGFDFFYDYIVDKIDRSHEITLFTYYLLLFLFLGSFLEVVYIICYIFKYRSKKLVIPFLILGIILSLIILPLHIVINPILLIYIFIKNNFNSNDILLEMKEVANYARKN